MSRASEQMVFGCDEMGMQETPKWAERPLGMRDVYPQQARVRRQLENTLLEFFEAHGFEMVSCGVFEYVDTLLRGRSREETAGWVQLFDTTGRAMALRPDITPSIARMGAPLVRNGKEIRWCYAERVYRRAHQSSSFTWSGTRAAESTQVGVEWLGKAKGGEFTAASGAAASSLQAVPQDLEVVSTDAALLHLCVDALRHLQLQNWQLVVGHAGFTPAFLEAIGISRSHVDDLLGELAQGNYVGFQQATEALLETAAPVLNELSQFNPYQPDSLHHALEKLPPRARAGWEQSEAGRNALAAWESLTSLARELQSRGIADGVAFDLTLCRDLTYYTGIVFEVFAAGAGAPIALGGRYDSLLSHFGTTAPAIGFTFEIEGLMNVVEDAKGGGDGAYNRAGEGEDR